MNDLDVSIVIPTLNRDRILLDTLDSLARLQPPPREILVVDQTLAHDEATRAYLEDAHRAGRIKWIRTEVANLPRARNIGARAARGAVLLFLDDDVAAPVDLVRRHQHLYRDAATSAVCGQVYQPAAFDRHMHDSFDIATSDYKSLPRLPTQPQRVAAIFRGCHFSVRSAVYRELGGFDEAFVGAANGEDTDFAYRLIEAGKRIAFDPDCHIVHWKAPSGGCRIAGNRSTPEWQKTASFLIFGLRHRRQPEVRAGALWQSLRMGPLRHENCVRFWRMPWAILSYLRALVYAGRAAGRPPLNTAGP